MGDRTTGTDTIVFIHGLYLTARSWELWEKRYTDRGYKVINESWPGLEVEVEALRKDPKPIARQSVEKILAHYESIIEGWSAPRSSSATRSAGCSLRCCSVEAWG